GGGVRDSRLELLNNNSVAGRLHGTRRLQLCSTCHVHQ
ncbi:unnamed protein product, partial [Allacma fusca]